MINSIVVDDFLGFSAGTINNHDFVSKFSMEQKDVYKVLRVESGLVKITFNGLNIILKKNQCLFINRNVSLIISSMDDFQLSFVQFKDSCIDKNYDINMMIKNSKLFDSEKMFNKISLKEKHTLIINHYLDLLFNLQLNERTSFNHLLAQNTIQQILLLSISIFNSSIPKCNHTKSETFAEKILKLFNETIVDNVKNNRSVKYYCDRIGVEYNVLNKLCLSTYGVSVKNYLDLKCLHQIKYKLESVTLSIKEISNYFNFSDISNFLRFFKRLTQMTVSQYREKILNRKPSLIFNPSN